MIHRLRRKFVWISAGSLFLVFALIFLLLCAWNRASVARSLDTLTDAVSAGGGSFPREEETPPPKKHTDPLLRLDGEAPFSTRYFTVFYLADGALSRVDTTSIHTVTEEDAVTYASEARARGADRGWTERYRYKIYQTAEGGSAVSFVDGGMQRQQARSFLLGALAVLFCGCLLVTLLTVALSRVAMRPAEESYKKQKRFITDAAHELKTPLTLILANAGIAEAELGESEWIEDIRAEGERMSALVTRMVTLCRMDEGTPSSFVAFSLSEAVADALSEFEPLAKERGISLLSTVDENVWISGDEGEIRRVLSILLDNAVKYCDENGEISVKLAGGRHASLIVKNSYKNADGLDTDRLFDRFYRADPARTAGGGFGIGLSIARAVAEAHHADLAAYCEGAETVAFRLLLRSLPKKAGAAHQKHRGWIK